jgi:hypothetical protein
MRCEHVFCLGFVQWFLSNTSSTRVMTLHGLFNPVRIVPVVGYAYGFVERPSRFFSAQGSLCCRSTLALVTAWFI